MRKVLFYSLAAVLVGGLWLYMHSATNQIRRVFKEVASVAERTEGESVMECAIRTKRLAEFVALSCHLMVPERSLDQIWTRDDVAGGILAFRSSTKSLRVKFAALQISIRSDYAEVKGEATLEGPSTFFGIEGEPQRKFAAQLKKDDHGNWLFTRLELVQ